MSGRGANEPTVSVRREQGGVVGVVFAGSWCLDRACPPLPDLSGPSSPCPVSLSFHCEDLDAWDSRFLLVVSGLVQQVENEGGTADRNGLPEGVRRLLRLAEEGRARTARQEAGISPPFLAGVGTGFLRWAHGARTTVRFLGELTLALGRFALGRSCCRTRDIWSEVGECGPRSLPIIVLITFLSGLILAFVGAIQLRLFGAQIYVADLVGIGITREMGAIMTGVVMSGRIGAAFAARLGTMQGNEEVDALLTLGLSPMEFLVLPRFLALVSMMPLLCVFADLMGILGGLVVGIWVLDLKVSAYALQTREAITLTDCAIGVFMSFVFGVLIAVAGCLRGLQCGRSAAAVGEATTSAVVTSIVWIVVATALITVMCNALGI